MEDYDIEMMFQDTPEASENPAPAETQEFRIDCKDKVEWALRKIGAWEDEIARVKAQSTAIITRLENERQRFLARFEADLEQYARQELEGSKRRSYDTMYGTMAFRKVPGGMIVSDKEKAIEAMRQVCPAAIVTELRLDSKSALEVAKQRMEGTGEILSGFDMRPERESFSIRFQKGES